jgi:hypothetical protein
LFFFPRDSHPKQKKLILMTMVDILKENKEDGGRGRISRS